MSGTRRERDHRRRPWLRFVPVLAVVAALGACTGSGGGSAAAGSTTATATATASGQAQPPSGVALQQAFEQVVNRVRPSVVQIRTQRGLGSGIVYDTHGDIVTNAHVVGDATRFQVRLATNSHPLRATLVGAYPPNDLAVIRLTDPPQHLQPAQFGNSSKLDVGQIVLAMGSPLGLQGSVTDGIVSAVGRTVNEPQSPHSPGAVLPNVIQTSAAINPGNSGGALVDLSGEVVGIPTLAAVDQELGGAAPGIGFAIPSNTITDLADQIIQHGKVVDSHRAALGITVQTVVQAGGQPAGVGIVDVVAGGPADRAGLQAGQVIVAIGGKPTPTALALRDALAQHKPGQQVKVTVLQPDGSKTSVTVTLGQLPAPNGSGHANP